MGCHVLRDNIFTRLVHLLPSSCPGLFTILQRINIKSITAPNSSLSCLQNSILAKYYLDPKHQYNKQGTFLSGCTTNFSSIFFKRVGKYCRTSFLFGSDQHHQETTSSRKSNSHAMRKAGMKESATITSVQCINLG